MARKPKKLKRVETLTHDSASRKNIPTAEHQPLMEKGDQNPIQVAYQRRNRDLDPQLVWRGKDKQDWSDLVVPAPPLFIQEKVHPKVLIDDLVQRSKETTVSQPAGEPDTQPDLFADFNGLPDNVRTEFYQHEANWSNRMILGDSLQVMASLAEREGLRGKIQCIYIDPPYGIKFNSNFQWSTTSRDVKDGNRAHIPREPEVVRAFRDTWRDGIHSYLTYLRDRFTVVRDLLTDNGSVFVQIGDENVHRVRAVMDEVFSDKNFVAQITFRVKSPLAVADLARTTDFIIWYARDRTQMKFRQARLNKELDRHPEFSLALLPDGTTASRKKVGDDGSVKRVRFFTAQNLGSSGYTPSCMYNVVVEGRTFKHPRGKSWKTNQDGMRRLLRAGRLQPLRTSLRWRYFFDDAPSEVITDIWSDTFAASAKSYVVQTSELAIQRCLLMTTDPGDLVLDPTCGSGTTAYVAELWGRRWITVDTSRVALALARARIMGGRYPYYLLADSIAGQKKEAAITRTTPSEAPTHSDIRQGFVYERVTHVTLKQIANDAEVDVIWEQMQPTVNGALASLNDALGGHPTPFVVQAGSRKGRRIDFTTTARAVVVPPSQNIGPAHTLLEWEVPRRPPEDWPRAAWEALEQFWKARISRQKEIDAAIAAKAPFENLYDKPYEDKAKVRVAGPFTVESLSPHRVLDVDHDDELLDHVAEAKLGYDMHRGAGNFSAMILEHLKTAGVQQAHKDDKIAFSSLTSWPGDLISADARYADKRAGIFIGPEFGTVSRRDLLEAAHEAADANFDVLIACAFDYEARASELSTLGRVPILKARMNADLHMASDLRNTGKGNLFVVFGEPDIVIIPTEGDRVRVKIKGVDVFHPNTGEIRSDSADGIACWFIDTDYNEESFFVRHAYFLGMNDSYKKLKTTLGAEINREAWDTLHSDTSRPFDRPSSGRIAVKVINHLGDEVMKVYKV